MKKWLFILGVLLWTSCFDDKGNYDYIDLGELTVDGIITDQWYEFFGYSDTLKIPIQIHSASTIEGKTAIPSDSEQGLMALIYGKDGLSGIPITEMEKGIVGVENDYVYYLSFQFGGNQSF